MAGHAGTVPMDMRQDALCAAAEFVLKAEQLALDHRDALVATVGKLNVPNSASNVIPGEVVCTLDLRSADESRLAFAYVELQQEAQAIARQRNVEITWLAVQNTAPVACSTDLNTLLAAATADSGHEVVKLVSGAGHDAVPISAVAPATMLFIRCYKGISHNPLENAELTDIAAAIQVSERFLALLSTQYPTR
jgi:allantoate deiminase